MNKFKKWATNLGILLALGAGLAAWIALPWQGLLVLTALLGLWLALTRRGKQTLAVAGVGIASLPQRWGSSGVIIVGIAGVVGVLPALRGMRLKIVDALAGR